MKVITGDLIKLAKEGKFDVIVHGCNCFCTMGAGIAKSIRQEFPEAYKADLVTEKGDKRKLGTFTYAHVVGYSVTVVNAYTQYHYGGGRVANIDYDAVRSVFRSIKLDFSYGRERVGYPKIGAGLAGGNWCIISKIIDKELEGEDHTLVKRR